MENLKNKLKLYIDNNLVVEERNNVGIFSKAKTNGN